MTTHEYTFLKIRKTRANSKDKATRGTYYVMDTSTDAVLKSHFETMEQAREWLNTFLITTFWE